MNEHTHITTAYWYWYNSTINSCALGGVTTPTGVQDKEIGKLSTVLHQPPVKYQVRYLGLGTGTVCTGSSNILVDPASILVSSFYITYVQETRHIIVREITKRVSGGDRREELSATPGLLDLLTRSFVRFFLMSGLSLALST